MEPCSIGRAVPSPRQATRLAVRLSSFVQQAVPECLNYNGAVGTRRGKGAHTEVVTTEAKSMFSRSSQGVFGVPGKSISDR